MRNELVRIVAQTRCLLEEHVRQGNNSVRLDPEVVDKLERLDRPLYELRQEALDCVKCKLHETRTTVVFGEGNAHARLMFVGEAPGRDEDLQGRPFVGQAGRLLTKIIESIGLTRDAVYIANILKCRPPNNRDPLPDETSCCIRYLFQQIELIQPKILCALGAHATRALLGTREGITKLRGRFYDYRGVKLMPTFHPAALLRNAGNKKYVWEDMKQIRAEYFGQ